jgi:hypothetical protein
MCYSIIYEYTYNNDIILFKQFNIRNNTKKLFTIQEKFKYQYNLFQIKVGPHAS